MLQAVTKLHDILAAKWNLIATEPLFDTGPVPPQFKDVLSADYLAVIREFGGREGFLGSQYLRLHRLDELPNLNAAYNVPTLARRLSSSDPTAVVKRLHSLFTNRRSSRFHSFLWHLNTPS